MTAAEPIGPAGGGADGARWRLALRVEPLHGEPFAATADADLPDGEPAIGGRFEVLHGPPRRQWLNWASRGVPIGTLLLGAPPVRAVEAPPGPAAAPAPAMGQVLRALARAAGDGSLAAGMPLVVGHPDPPPGGPPPPADPATNRGLTLEALARRARDDPRGVADEIVRRLDAGEATPAQMLLAARATGLAPEDVLSVLAAVRARRA